MKVKYTKTFVRAYRKLPSQKQVKVDTAIKQLVLDSTLPSLRFHQLKGALKGIWSVSAGGDLRIHLHILIEKGTYLLIDVGTHSQLYK